MPRMKYQKEEHTPGLCLNKMFIYIHVKLNIFLRASFFFINYEFRWSIGYIYSRRNVCYSTVYARIGGPRYIPLFTTFWVRARKEHTCDLCIFQNAHLTQCAQRHISNLLDFPILMQGWSCKNLFYDIKVI